MAEKKFSYNHKNHVYRATRFDSTIFDNRLRKSPKMRALVDCCRKKTGDQSLTFASEVFARLYSDVEKAGETKGPKWESRAHELIESDGFKDLVDKVCGDADFSMIAAQGLIDKLQGALSDIKKEADEEVDERDDGLPTQSKITKIKMKRACAEVSEELDEIKAAVRTIFPGSENAPPKSEQKDGGRFDMLQKILSMESFKRVIEMSGRMVRIREQKKKTTHRDVQTEVVDERVRT
jgi:hypothetical protein